MSEANAELIRRLYGAFDARDGDAMAAVYAPDARFSDPSSPTCGAASPERCGECSPPAPTT